VATADPPVVVLVLAAAVVSEVEVEPEPVPIQPDRRVEIGDLEHDRDESAFVVHQPMLPESPRPSRETDPVTDGIVIRPVQSVDAVVSSLAVCWSTA
jgi:hypothetical protein